MLKIGFHIAISPDIKFYSRIKWLRKSLDYLGEPYNKSVFHICLSNENNITIDSVINSFPEFHENKSRYFFYLTDRHQFEEYSYAETAGLRFKNIDDSDITIFCDADIFFVNEIDNLINAVKEKKGIYGVIAHYSPFSNFGKSIEDSWNNIAQKIIGEKLDLKYTHSLKKTDKCPAYFNFGFVIGDKESWNKIKDYAYKNFKEVFHSLPSNDPNYITGPKFFCMQVSLSLVLQKFKIKTYPINEIFNCANEEAMLPLINNKTEDIRVIHYLRNKLYDRDKIFVDNQATLDFLKMKKLDPISLKFQSRVNDIFKKYEIENVVQNQSFVKKIVNKLVKIIPSYKKQGLKLEG
ncbi:MAG: hypothetical protein ACOCUL_00030 [Bacteroidota bacterium]